MDERDEQALRDALAFAESIVDTMRDPLLVLDGNLRVVTASQQFYRSFGVTREETEGRLVYELGNRQWDIPRLRTLLEDILPQESTFRDFEVEHVFDNIGRKIMLLNARKLDRKGHGDDRILLVIEDATERRDAERARQEAETRFTEMVKNVRDHSIFLTDPDGVITSWNVAAERVIGYPESEAVGQDFSLIFTAEDVAAGVPLRELQQAREWGRAEDERWHQRKDGKRFWALGIVSPLRDTSGRITGYSKVLRDMTERRDAEQALRVSEERSRLIVEAARDYAILTTDPEGIITSWSPGAEVVFGWSPTEVVGRPVDMTFTPEDRTAGAPEQERATARASGSAPDVRWHVRKDGKRVFIEGVMRAIADGFLKIGQDVTERRQAEESLRESEELLKGQKEAFQAALRGTPLKVSLDRLIRIVTEQASDGVRAAFYLVNADGTALHPIIVPAGMPETEARMVDGHWVGMPSLACGLAVSSRSPVITKDVFEEPAWAPFLHLAKEFDFRGCWCFPIETHTGKPVGTFAMYHREPRTATSRDLVLASTITQAAAILISIHTETEDRARAEADLRASEKRLKVALAAARMGIWTLDLESGVQRRDENLNRLLGLEPVETTQSFEEFLTHIHADDRAAVRGAFAASTQEGKPLNVEFRAIRPDGSVRWLRDQGDIFGDAGARRMAGACVDVTERAEAEARVRASEDRLRQILASATDFAILTLDSARNITGWSPGAAAVFGYSEEVMLGRRSDELFIPEDRAAGEPEREAERARREGRAADERWHVRRGGQRFYASGVLTPLGDGGFVKVLRDLTDRKLMEDELRDADRRKDEFLAMLGHELRNPLAPLRGVVETLQRQHVDDDGLAKAHAMMERQVGHLSHLVDDLLDVSRITRGLVELRKEPLDLARVIDQAAEMVAPAVQGRGHNLTLALPHKPLRVEGDSTRLTQVVFNLLNNAAKYTDAGGKIWLTLERDGDRAVVRVRDNGSGMKADLVPKVFDLFTQGERSLDRSQGGLGLGLTLVKRLVEMHGGTVEARSEGIGKGSEFTVRLPALREEVAKPSPVRVTRLPTAAVQVDRILVVDDNLDVAESTTWILEGLARETKMAFSGSAALEIAPEFKPDLILCDIGMPGMDGYETCRRLRQLPGLDKTVIAAVSGYGNEDDRRKSMEAGFNRHLVKPIGRTTLEELVMSAAARFQQA
jgi:PAS domain S-box-containing protein